MKNWKSLLFAVTAFITVFSSCSDKDKDTLKEGIEGNFKISKVETGIQNMFTDITSVYLDDCDKGAIYNFTSSKISVTYPEACGDYEPFEVSYNINDGKLETEISQLRGDIVENNGSKLVVETDWEYQNIQVRLRVTLTKV